MLYQWSFEESQIVQGNCSRRSSYDWHYNSERLTLWLKFWIDSISHATVQRFFPGYIIDLRDVLDGISIFYTTY